VSLLTPQRGHRIASREDVEEASGEGEGDLRQKRGRRERIKFLFNRDLQSLRTDFAGGGSVGRKGHIPFRTINPDNR